MASSTRRSFLSSVVAASAALPLGTLAAPAVRRGPVRVAPRNILVLGGTGFLGPHFVRKALANGHTVTLFNRGKTNSDLFPELEKLRGDREKGDLDALKGRKFDAVIDTSGYVPAHVEAAATLLRDNVAHYQFISTISVYGSFGERPDSIDEATEVATVEDDKIAEVNAIRQAMPFYGPLKARCEAAAEAAMPGRVSNLRPGLIVGPGDTSDRFTWWPWRIAQGGEVLAPGDQDGHSQFLDVRDLAAWMLHVVEQNVVGVHNAVGFAGRVSLGEVLAACKCATAAPVTLTWASEEFLQEHKVRPYMEMPLWIPREGRSMVQNGKAMAAGLTFRPIADTIRDTLEWARTERGDKPFTRTGLRPEREQELLKLWHERQKGGR